jgi:hypothetical protein
MDYYIGELERPFGRSGFASPGRLWPVLNIAIPALGKKEAITELRRITDWLEHTDTRRPPN